jgi:hypothetical protein
MEEETWEKKLEIKRKYPNLFAKIGKKFKFREQNFIRRGESKPLKNK